MSEKEELPSTSNKSTGAPSRPTLSLPPRPFTEMFFNGGVGFSPGPMTLVSNMFPDSDEFRSFSQLLSGVMPSPAPAPAPAAASSAASEEEGDNNNSSSGDVDPRFKQSRPTGLTISQSPSTMFNVPPGLSPAMRLDSPSFLGLFSPIQGSYGMTHQQALAQVTAQAVQANANNMLLPQTDYPPPSSQVSSVQPPQNQTTAPRETSDTTTIIEHRSQQPLNVDKPADDGYNWRKYGQKQVKGSEFPRSYYKCTSQGCPVKKKVERSLDGQVTEIIYKGQHNHEPPQNTKRGNNRDSTANLNGSSVNNSNTGNKTTREQHEAASQATTEQMSEASDSEEVGNGETGVRKKVEDEPDPKRRSTEVRVTEPAAATSHRTVTEPRIIVQTTSEVDLLDDGYRWRKYGQKVVKGNPYPRSYYKCTTQGCGVRKHVERAATDPKAVVTTYEGKHNHDLPASKSSSHSAAAAAHLRLENRPGGSANLNQQQQQQPVARLRLKEEQII
ncbi:putative WRKY transcription factor 4 [Raphanus sativus]|uniref:Probable WRKY transcription factor 4 n=1 Tax=Raphanus sativus TaxID=3726 RepID=A0A6J0JUQ1_RAPSA|nr:probable WRKY transcription factor 4 [Raphanus sativus]KAJ4915716.1 putative WRKY transcription factor 4 [Raphanus sativus]